MPNVNDLNSALWFNKWAKRIGLAHMIWSICMLFLFMLEMKGPLKSYGRYFTLLIFSYDFYPDSPSSGIKFEGTKDLRSIMADNSIIIILCFIYNEFVIVGGYRLYQGILQLYKCDLFFWMFLKAVRLVVFLVVIFSGHYVIFPETCIIAGFFNTVLDIVCILVVCEAYKSWTLFRTTEAQSLPVPQPMPVQPTDGNVDPEQQ
ncbi:uncharacterized protein [Periplaneta americana]|uniref:uncharacterized protein n=1 Tax=Periplaneta americana TaxID=6978 RepID=UPI0037E7A1FE